MFDALEFLARDADIQAAAADEPCGVFVVGRVPNFQITGIYRAVNMRIWCKMCFGFITSSRGTIPEDWFARQLSYCDKADGDIDTLSNRIAHVRTWTFVANRVDWLDDALHWQARAKEIEDKLSDALHNRLSQRFIDRKTAVLMKRLRQREEIMSVVEDSGDVLVEGELVGRIAGLQFKPGDEALGKPMKEAVQKTLVSELVARAQAIAAAPDPDFTLDGQGAIRWRDAAIGNIAAGANSLKPVVKLAADEVLEGFDRDAVQQRLEKFVQRHIASVLEPLVGLAVAEDLSGIAAGLAFQLLENYGVLARAGVADDIKSLGQDERGSLRKFGVRFGAIHIFAPALLKPAATQLRLLLWGLEREKAGTMKRSELPDIPGQGLTSVPLDSAAPDGFYQITGYKPCGGRAVRIDMLERLSDLIRPKVFWRPQFDGDQRPAGSVEGGGFVVISDMMSLVGCSGSEFSAILTALDFKPHTKPASEVSYVKPVLNEPAKQPSAAKPSATDDSEPGQAEDAEADQPAKATTEEHAQVVAEEPVPEETVDVWWPDGTGPFRKKQRQAAKSSKRPQRDSKPRKARAKPAARQPGRRDIKPEDSPFAALSALRSQLSDKG